MDKNTAKSLFYTGPPSATSLEKLRRLEQEYMNERTITNEKSIPEMIQQYSPDAPRSVRRF